MARMLLLTALVGLLSCGNGSHAGPADQATVEMLICQAGQTPSGALALQALDVLDKSEWTPTRGRLAVVPRPGHARVVLVVSSPVTRQVKINGERPVSYSALYIEFDGDGTFALVVPSERADAMAGKRIYEVRVRDPEAIRSLCEA